MASDEKAIRDLSRRIDLVEDLLHVLVRLPPVLFPKIITDRGETESAATIAPSHYARVSVDQSPNDPGALHDAHCVYEEAVNKKINGWHLCTRDAFANLRGGGPHFSVIVGHGNSGRINTGSGFSDTTDNTKHMCRDNVKFWKSDASAGFDSDHLVLFGCYVAEGVEGADFLQELARVTKKDVSGWTGVPRVRDGNLRGDGCFLTAHKNGPPLTPVNYPEHYDGKREIAGLLLEDPDASRRVPLRFITSVNFTPIGYVPKIPKAFTLRNSKARSLIKLIDFEHPVTMPGRLLAIRTGQLTITFESKNGLECRAFYLLGYLLLQDAWFPNTYYHASHRLLRVLHRG
jgi:hypothetical protein